MSESPPAVSKETGIATGPSRFIPLAVLTALLLVVGFSIWQRASKAILPPLFDAAEYHVKAANCWKALHEGHHRNLLNIAPVTRPPGTLLVSHPFGFTPDFRGFFFRTVYVPLIVVLLAFWFFMESGGTQPRERWCHFTAALGMAGLPLFHHLEKHDGIRSPSYWGLMDTFEASLAVLAVVLLLVSARRLSLPLLAAGTSVAALTLLVKPVGLILMPLILWHWAAEMFAIHTPVRTGWRSSRALRRYTIAAVLFFLLICPAVVICCTHSDYLKYDAFLYFRHATEILGQRLDGHRLERVLSGFHYTLGWHWALALGALLTARTASLFRGLRRKRMSVEDIRFFAAFAAFCGGICWWLFMAGPLYRYIEPFLLVFLVVVLPDVARAATLWSRRLRMQLGIACCAPFLFILTLLVAHHPPLLLQRLAGVNLSTGQFAAEIGLGKFLRNESAQAGHRELVVYGIAQEWHQGMVGDSALGYAMLENTTPGFHFAFDLDWVRPTMIRRNEIVNADYILFHPVADPAQLDEWLARKNILDSPAEEQLFEAWLTRAGSEEGLQSTGMGTQNLRLLKIADRAKFDAAFTRLMHAHEWRPIFHQENTR